VNWAMIVGAVVIMFIGGTMSAAGDTNLVRGLGRWILIISGMLLALGLNIPAQAGWIKPDSNACAQYVQMEGAWKCVPWEQGG